MSETQLDLLNELARLRGLGEAYYDHRGELRHFSTLARRAILQAMGIDVENENALRAAIDQDKRGPSTASNKEIGARQKPCFQSPMLATKKAWGLGIQLYTLRSARNWGIGDYGDLYELIELAAPLGCDVIGINPLHALFPADPQHCSPYSPSNRSFLNILSIAIDAIPEYARCAPLQALCAQAGFQSKLTTLRVAEKVRYEQVAVLKVRALHLLHDDFHNTQLAIDSERARSFREFVAHGGEALQMHAAFDTLDQHFRSQGIAGWPQWSDEYRDPHSHAVRAFISAHEYDVEFFLYAQWLADEQLRRAQQLARDKGMRIGLYGDLAVGASPDGSEVWSNQALYVRDAAIGAPPDPLALNGQDWGVPPINPHVLREQHMQPFVDLVRANMQHAGALRIDHVMSLFRLWWVPRGFIAVDGVYVHYPLDSLIDCLVQESERAKCLVIGEDLGTVPDEVRDAMEQYQLYHYKVLLFEKHGDGRFRLPSEYLRHSVATVTTHDLPPLRAWWQGDDLALRDRLSLYPTADTANRLHTERTADRYALLRALGDMGLWHWQENEKLPEFSLALARAIHLYLGASNSGLVLVQLEDLIGMTDPVNVPGTHNEHANWQRKLIAETQDIFKREEVREMLTAIGKTRTGIDPSP